MFKPTPMGTPSGDALSCPTLQPGTGQQLLFRERTANIFNHSSSEGTVIILPACC